MSSLSTLMTWEAFERLPDHDGWHREILKGVLQVLPAPMAAQTIMAHAALKMLIPREEQFSYQAFVEAGYKLSEDPATWVQPDVSLLSESRIRATARDDYFTGAPDLAVEVVSPSESAADIEEKVELMLEAGSQAVWVVYPKTRTVHVFAPGGSAAILSTKDSLTAPSLLPGWSAPVAKLFEE